MSESPSVVKSVRLPRDLLDRLEAQAKTEHRTVNNLVAAILTDGLDRRTLIGRQPPADGSTVDDAVTTESKDASA